MNLRRWQAVDFPLRFRDTLEDGDGFFLHPRRELALVDEFFYVGEVALVVVAVLVVLVMVAMVVFGVMVMVRMTRIMFVVIIVCEMDVKLHAFDGGLVLARDMEVIAVELEFAEFVFEFVRVHPQVNQGADEHVAADAAEDVEVKGFHFKISVSGKPVILNPPIVTPSKKPHNQSSPADTSQRSPLRSSFVYNQKWSDRYTCRSATPILAGGVLCVRRIFQSVWVSKMNVFSSNHLCSIRIRRTKTRMSPRKFTFK